MPVDWWKQNHSNVAIFYMKGILHANDIVKIS